MEGRINNCKTAIGKHVSTILHTTHSRVKFNETYRYSMIPVEGMYLRGDSPNNEEQKVRKTNNQSTELFGVDGSKETIATKLITVQTNDYNSI
jgi:hypothetical protein